MIKQFQHIANAFETDRAAGLTAYYMPQYNVGILRQTPDPAAVAYADSLDLQRMVTSRHMNKVIDESYWISGYFGKTPSVREVDDQLGRALPAGSGRTELLDDIARKSALHCALTGTSEVACAMFVRLAAADVRLHQDGGSSSRPSVTRGVTVYKGSGTLFAADGAFCPIDGSRANFGSIDNPDVAGQLAQGGRFSLQEIKSQDYPYTHTLEDGNKLHASLLKRRDFSNSSYPAASVHAEGPVPNARAGRLGIILRCINPPKTINLEKITRRLEALGR